MEFYTYILQSESSGSLYIGSTNNLEDRLLRHNSDQNTYTKGKGPWSLLFSVTFSTRSEAVQLERFLKSKKSKPRVLAWIASQPRYRIPPRSFCQKQVRRKGPKFDPDSYREVSRHKRSSARMAFFYL